MLQSTLFTKTRREAPKDEVSKNAQLLIRGGFIHKEIAGVYTYLPLGFRVLKKIEGIIREEMERIGGQEMLLTTLQDPALWKTSDRWSDAHVDIWFRTKLRNGNEIGVANTHEEPLTKLLTEHVRSYKDLPIYAYQFQNKFRNELRAKSGIMRGREFIMKDLYSFSRTEEDFRAFYETCAEAYMRIFTRVGIGENTYRTFASGGSFSKYSDEFQTLCDTGEDTIFIDDEKRTAINKEVYVDDVLLDLGLVKDNMREAKTIEVGNIFPLGTRFSEALALSYKDENGHDRYPIMGSYGIGLGRLMGTVVEVLSDASGIIWPPAIAPFHTHLLVLDAEDARVKASADALYKKLSEDGNEVLYDDRGGVRPGEKFSDADLLGIPRRVIVSAKTVEAKKVEVTDRATGETKIVSEDELVS